MIGYTPLNGGAVSVMTAGTPLTNGATEIKWSRQRRTVVTGLPKGDIRGLRRALAILKER